MVHVPNGTGQDAIGIAAKLLWDHSASHSGQEFRGGSDNGGYIRHREVVQQHRQDERNVLLEQVDDSVWASVESVRGLRWQQESGNGKKHGVKGQQQLQAEGMWTFSRTSVAFAKSLI